jgi:uncharacterized protein
MFDLPDKDIDYILKIIKSYPNITEAIVFGSRAKGNNKSYSDIDIALKGKQLDSTVLEISGRLNDEGPLPYHVDILDYNTIDNLKLIEHIDRVGKVFYKS